MALKVDPGSKENSIAWLDIFSGSNSRMLSGSKFGRLAMARISPVRGRTTMAVMTLQGTSSNCRWISSSQMN